MDSLLRIQDRVRKDPKIKEEDKLMDNDLHQMSRDIIMAGRLHLLKTRIQGLTTHLRYFRFAKALSLHSILLPELLEHPPAWD